MQQSVDIQKFVEIAQKSVQFAESVQIVRAVALVHWLKLPAWKVGDRGFEPHSGLQVSKKQSVSSSLTCKDLILWVASVTER